MVRAITLRRFVARLAVILPFAALLCAPSPGLALPVILDTAQSFAVIGVTGVANPPTDATSVIGNLGTLTPTTITGFPLGTVSGGIIHDSDGPAISANAAVGRARLGLLGLPGTTGLSLTSLTGSTLGVGPASSLGPGVYTFATTAQLNNTLTLNAGGAIDPVFVFLIGTSLTTGAGSSVFMNPGGVNGGRDAGVFWVTGTTATLGVDSTFEGNILALTTIELQLGAEIVCGRAFTQTNVAFDGVSPTPKNNIVDSQNCTGTAGAGSPTNSSGFSGGLEFTGPESTVLALIQEGGGPGPGVGAPEPSSFLLLAAGLIGVAARMRRARAR